MRQVVRHNNYSKDSCIRVFFFFFCGISQRNNVIYFWISSLQSKSVFSMANLISNKRNALQVFCGLRRWGIPKEKIPCLENEFSTSSIFLFLIENTSAQAEKFRLKITCEISFILLLLLLSRLFLFFLN